VNHGQEGEKKPQRVEKKKKKITELKCLEKKPTKGVGGRKGEPLNNGEKEINFTGEFARKRGSPDVALLTLQEKRLITPGEGGRTQARRPRKEKKGVFLLKAVLGGRRPPATIGVGC